MWDGNQQEIEANDEEMKEKCELGAVASAEAIKSPASQSVLERLESIRNRPENAFCADCDVANPKWAAVSHGGFICTQCAGVHRSLGVHVSFVLSCTLDKWTEEQLQVVDAIGNDRLNEEMEFAIPPDFRKPRGKSSREDRAKFIRAKYDQQLFRQSDQNGVKCLSPHATSQEADECETESDMAGLTGISSTHGMVEYVGVLVIELIEGVNLAGMDINGKSDPYVVFRLGAQTISSNKVINSVNPIWQQTLMLSWDGVSPLMAEIYDHNSIAAHRAMGSVLVDEHVLSRLHDSPFAIDMWHQALMPREWAQNFSEHIVAGAEGVGKGIYRGITGIWKDPIRGAKADGIGGFAKGVGTGVAGVVYRPIKGLGMMVKQTALGVRSTKKERRQRNRLDMVEAGCLHLKLSLQKF